MRINERKDKVPEGYHRQTEYGHLCDYCAGGHEHTYEQHRHSVEDYQRRMERRQKEVLRNGR